MEMHQWVTGIRVAKSGKQLFTNYRAIEEEITHADIDILTSKRFSVNSPPNSLAINQSGELSITTKKVVVEHTYVLVFAKVQGPKESANLCRNPTHTKFLQFLTKKSIHHFLLQ